MRSTAPKRVGRANAGYISVISFWCIALAAIVAITQGAIGRPRVAVDSFQYLSVAQNVASGAGLRTSLVHFDEERLAGVVPAPLTTFPVGYPVAIAAVEVAGIDGESAGWIVSAIATLANVVLLLILAVELGVDALGRFTVLGMFALNMSTIEFASAVLSDSFFTAAVLASLTLTAKSFRATNSGGRWVLTAVCAGLLLGLSYWIRYAGLFVFAGVCATATATVVLKATRERRVLLVSCATASVVIACSMLRNMLLVASWKGGNNKVVHNSAGKILHDFAAAVRDLLVGSSEASHLFAVRTALAFLLVAAVLAGFMVRARRSKSFPGARDSARGRTELLLSVVVVTYVVCLAYTAAITPILFSTRYLYPMLPLVLALAGRVVFGTRRPIQSQTNSTIWAGGAAALLCLYGGIHVDAWLRMKPESTAADALRALQSRDADNRSASDVIVSAAGLHGTIMATDGQAIGYVLRSPTISLVGPDFSSREWDESYVRATIKRFAINAVVIANDGPDSQVSAFVSKLSAGHAPDWLTKVSTTDRLTIYRPTSEP